MNDNENKLNNEEQTIDNPMEINSEKKKLHGYALVRVIMMCLFAALFIVFATITVIYKIRDAKAQNMTDSVMSGFNEITRPGTAPDNTDPILIPSVSTPESTPESTPGSTPESGSSELETPPAETPPPVDEEYQKYVAECIAEAKKMKEKYPDFIGFMVIDDGYRFKDFKRPILQSTDNQYYVEHLIDGTPNTTGEVFLDFRNESDILDNRNSVIYGHNMNDGSKFGQIKSYKYAETFYARNITIITPECVMTFKPFSYYQTEIKTPYTRIPFSSDEEFAEFCRSEQAKSKHPSNYQFTGQERIITLSTCYGTSLTERHCVHAVLVDIAK